MFHVSVPVFNGEISPLSGSKALALKRKESFHLPFTWGKGLKEQQRLIFIAKR